MIKQITKRKEVIIGAVFAIFLIAFATVSVTGEPSEKGYLGVSVEDISKAEMEELKLVHGVRVVEVVEDEAAEKAGILEKDIIQYFNDEKIRDSDDLVGAVRDVKPGTGVTVKLVRDGKTKVVNVSVGELKSKNFSFGLAAKDNNFFYSLAGGRAYLGVYLQEMDEDLAAYFGTGADGGALILQVEVDSPAEKAGLKSGDVIVDVAGESVKGPDDVQEALGDFVENEECEITVLRHKKKKKVKAELKNRSGFNTVELIRGSSPEVFSISPKAFSRVPNLGLSEFFFNSEDLPDVLKKKQLDIKKQQEEFRKQLRDHQKKLRKKMLEKQEAAREKMRKRIKSYRRFIRV